MIPERNLCFALSLLFKVKVVAHTSASQLKEQRFAYGADGQRIAKATHELGDNQAKTRTHYIRDAQGNVMAVYQYDRGTNSLKLTERPLYGSDRLGMDARPVELYGLTDLGLRNTSPLPTGDGELRYELKDHLGNVAATLYGQVYGVDQNNDGQLDRFYPKVLGSQGYEAFGSLLPGRNYSSGSYRFGFQGQDKDDEV